MDKGYIVAKSNKLICANYDLSLQEQKVILTLASMVQPQDTEFKEYEFKIKDFMNLLGVEDKKKYIEIPKLTKDLMKKVFEIKEGKDIIQLSWLSSARYKTGEGTIILKFDSSLKPYFLELKELYTSYKLDNVLSLKSKYSIRFYEILKGSSFKQNIEIELEDIKKMVGAREKAYNTYANFKNKVLLQAQKELKEKTDIDFDFGEIKTGRKITAIRFYIKNNKKPNDPKQKQVEKEVVADKETPLDLIEDDIKSIMSITNNEFTEKNVILFRDLCNGDINKIEQCYKYMKTKEINSNKIGYMRKLLKDFEEPKKSKANTSDNEIGTGFNNFKPREYDYDNLERKLLGWDE